MSLSLIEGAALSSIAEAAIEPGMFAAPLSPEELSEIRDALHLRKQKVNIVGMDRHGGALELVVGEIRDVVDLDEILSRQNLINLGATWSGVPMGVYRHADGLLVIMAIDRSGACAKDWSAAA